jgi:glycosyltransferase involved in cell wall biosynthesis
VIIVVPCFNEAERLVPEAWLPLLERAELLFVNDGSQDRTLAILEHFAAREARVQVLDLPINRGKAEAVRQGLLAALERPAAIVAFADADLATPPHELLRLAEHLRDPAVQVVMGARLALLGSKIERDRVRHYLGRVFATLASFTVGAQVYDTQCGAKFFRRGPALAAALAEPFHSRWSFDVELLGRLMQQLRQAGIDPESGAIVEVALNDWRDVPGSKLKTGAMVRSALDLGRIAWHLRRGR